jgi:hypothetical protein
MRSNVTAIDECCMGAKTRSILIELSEDSMDAVPYLSTVVVIVAIATSVVGVAATDMVAESSAQKHRHIVDHA